MGGGGAAVTVPAPLSNEASEGDGASSGCHVIRSVVTDDPVESNERVHCHCLMSAIPRLADNTNQRWVLADDVI